MSSRFDVFQGQLWTEPPIPIETKPPFPQGVNSPFSHGPNPPLAPTTAQGKAFPGLQQTPAPRF